MADDNVVNGAKSGDRPVDVDRTDSDVAELKKKIEVLERERDDLVNENSGKKDLVKKLNKEIKDLKSSKAEALKKIELIEKEVAGAQESNRAAEAIAKRAFDLETELTRLQHETIAESSAADEARKDAEQLRKDLEKKESRVQHLEKEVAGLKQAKAESEAKVKELEKKLAVLEKKEVEEKKKRINIEEDLRDKLSAKEKEAEELKANISELEKGVVSSGSDGENWVEEKKNLEEELMESQEIVQVKESTISRLQKELHEAEEVIGKLRKKAFKVAERSVNNINVEEKGLKLYQPLVVAGSAMAIAAAAASAYFYYAKRR